eukprot:1653582-Prymnesium_polylepis.1
MSIARSSRPAAAGPPSTNSSRTESRWRNDTSSARLTRASASAKSSAYNCDSIRASSRLYAFVSALITCAER